MIKVLRWFVSIDKENATPPNEGEGKNKVIIIL